MSYRSHSVNYYMCLWKMCSHAEQVAQLTQDRQRAEINDRAKKLSLKKVHREDAKARLIAEKKLKQDKKDQLRDKPSVRSSMVALTVAVKLKAKATKARSVVEAERRADAQALEAEQTARIKAHRNAALCRDGSFTVAGAPLPSFKDFYVQRAKKELKYEEDQEEKPAVVVESVDERDGEDESDADKDEDEDVTANMTAEEVFRMKLEENEGKERELISAQSSRKLTSESPYGADRSGENGGRGSGDSHSITLEKKLLKKFDDCLPPHLFDQYFTELVDHAHIPPEEVLRVYELMEANKFFTSSSLAAIDDIKLMSWVDIIFLSILHCKNSSVIVLAGLKLAMRFPYERLPIPSHKVSFCSIIGKVLTPHIDNEGYCTTVLQYGVKITSQKNVLRIEHCVDNEGLGGLLKILLNHGQQRDTIGNAPKVVTTCLKFIKNICVYGSVCATSVGGGKDAGVKQVVAASRSHCHSRMMAAGVGSFLVKLLVFYRTDEAVVSNVCRSMAALITHSTLSLAQFSSPECVSLFMLILKTTPTNKTIAKTVGVLLIEMYAADKEAAEAVYLKIDFAGLLKALLVAQKDVAARFSLSVIECNMMMASYFIVQVTELKSHFLAIGVEDTLREYQQDQQNFGNTIDVVVQRCLKHLTSE